MPNMVALRGHPRREGRGEVCRTLRAGEVLELRSPDGRSVLLLAGKVDGRRILAVYAPRSVGTTFAPGVADRAVIDFGDGKHAAVEILTRKGQLRARIDAPHSIRIRPSYYAIAESRPRLSLCTPRRHR